MNGFEAGFGGMPINVPKKDNLESGQIENKIEDADIVREFQMEENKELSSSLRIQKNLLFFT